MEARALLVIGAAFALGAVVILLARRDPARRALSRELERLFLLELAIVGAILLPALAGPEAFTFAMMALAGLTQAELIQALSPKARAGDRRLVVILGMGFVGLAPLAGNDPRWHLIVALVVAILVGELVREPADEHLARLAPLAFSLVYPPMFIGSLVRIMGRPEGFALLAFLYAVVETCDSFALLAGKLAGRSQVFPSLSPKKTWGGLMGGLLVGTLTAGAFLLVAPRVPGDLIVPVTAAVLAATVLGDLVTSRIKRSRGLKDFGAGRTPHGGFLDIYDSLIFAAPIFEWVLVALALD